MVVPALLIGETIVDGSGFRIDAVEVAFDVGVDGADVALFLVPAANDAE